MQFVSHQSAAQDGLPRVSLDAKASAQGKRGSSQSLKAKFLDAPSAFLLSPHTL